MRKIYFATTNEGKLKEAGEILKLDVVGIPLEIDEIQSLDLKEVAVKKARAYFKEIKKPLFVEDVGLSFEALGGLPGAYINDFSKALGNGGLVKLIKDEKNRNASAKVVVVYIDKNSKEHVFEGEVKGTISKKPRGDNGFGWDAIFIPKGSKKTFGEMSLKEKNKYSMRKKALEKFKFFLKNTP